MILVDTSVWIGHLRQADNRLMECLTRELVVCHPFVIGEVSLGSMRRRDDVLDLLGTLPRAAIADHNEVMTLVTRQRLVGKGLGWIDAHLLASAVLAHAGLWTLDKALASAADALGIEARF